MTKELRFGNRRMNQLRDQALDLWQKQRDFSNNEITIQLTLNGLMAAHKEAMNDDEPECAENVKMPCPFCKTLRKFAAGDGL